MGVEKRRVPLAGDQPRGHPHRDLAALDPEAGSRRRPLRFRARPLRGVDPVVDRAGRSRASETQPLDERSHVLGDRDRAGGRAPGDPARRSVGLAQVEARASRERRRCPAPPPVARRAGRGDRRGSDACGARSGRNARISRRRAATSSGLASGPASTVEWETPSSRSRSVKSSARPVAATHIRTSTPASARAGSSDSRCRSDPPMPLTFCTCRTLMLEQLRFASGSCRLEGARSRRQRTGTAYRCYHVPELVPIPRRTPNRAC